MDSLLINTTAFCPKCGKPKWYTGDYPPEGFSPGTEPYCTCNSFKQNIHIGWVCGKCGTSLSPYTAICPNCRPPLQIT